MKHLLLALLLAAPAVAWGRQPPEKAAAGDAISIGALYACGDRDGNWRNTVTRRLIHSSEIKILLEELMGPPSTPTSRTKDQDWLVEYEAAFMIERRGAEFLVREAPADICPLVEQGDAAYQLDKVTNDPSYKDVTPDWEPPAAVLNAAWKERMARFAVICGLRDGGWQSAAHDAITLDAQNAWGYAPDKSTAKLDEEGIVGAMKAADLIASIEALGNDRQAACADLAKSPSLAALDKEVNVLLAHPRFIPSSPAIAPRKH